MDRAILISFGLDGLVGYDGKTLKNRAFLSVVFLDMFEKIVYTVYAVEGKRSEAMNRYRIRISVDGKRKLYYIEDQENYDIVLLPSKYLKHKADANRSPNTVRRLALSICYYLNYLIRPGTELLQVAKKSFEEQSSHFGSFLYWLVEGRHITDNRTAKTGNGTCNAYLKDVVGFFLYLADNGYTEPLRVLAYNQITVSNTVGVKRTIRSKSFKGYLKEKDRNVRAAQEPEIIDILRACTNLRDQLLLLLLAETGFRIGEILGVDYTKDIDYEKQVLKVYFPGRQRQRSPSPRMRNTAQRRSAGKPSSSCCIIWRNTGGYCSGRASCL